MEIIWHGDTSFIVREKGSLTVAVNPRKGGKIKEADIVLTNLPEAEQASTTADKIFDWPGEYETKGVPVDGIPVPGMADAIIFRFEVGGLTFCHIGNCPEKLESETITTIGDVDVLMIKVGENGLTGKQAMEIIEEIGPRSVIPMGEGSPAAAMKDSIPETVEAQEKVVLKGRSDLSDDKMEYFVLSQA